MVGEDDDRYVLLLRGTVVAAIDLHLRSLQEHVHPGDCSGAAELVEGDEVVGVVLVEVVFSPLQGRVVDLHSSGCECHAERSLSAVGRSPDPELTLLEGAGSVQVVVEPGCDGSSSWGGDVGRSSVSRPCRCRELELFREPLASQRLPGHCSLEVLHSL